MDYTETLDQLKNSLKEFRLVAEARLLDKSTTNSLFKLRLKNVVGKILDLQILLNDI